MYEYKAKVTGVYDGDSITVDVDLGFNMVLTDEKFRLLGIDTPEIRGTRGEEREKALEARDFLRDSILDKEVTIKSVKPKDKYGRYLVEVWIDDVNMNQEMLQQDFTREYNGGRKEPWNFE